MGEPEVVVAVVDVGGTSMKGALVDAEGRVRASRRKMVKDIPPGGLVAAVVAVFTDLVAAAKSAGTPGVALGLAVPGLVDERHGVGVLSMLVGWRDVPFVKVLEGAFGLPVTFSHDVSAGAYAQARRGPARGHADWLFLALGTGLGSTFVLSSRPYRGSGGTGGELAHVVCEESGPLCRCGKRGCLEMVSSAEAISTLYAQASQSSNPSDGDPGSGAVSAAEVVARARHGDPAAVAVWDWAIAGLATVVGGYVESLNPSVVIVGGGLAEAGAQLLDPFSQQLAERVTFARPAPQVHPAAFGDLAAVHGVAIRAHEQLASGIGGLSVPFDSSTSFDQPDRSGSPDGPTREVQR